MPCRLVGTKSLNEPMLEHNWTLKKKLRLDNDGHLVLTSMCEIIWICLAGLSRYICATGCGSLPALNVELWLVAAVIECDVGCFLSRYYTYIEICICVVYVLSGVTRVSFPNTFHLRWDHGKVITSIVHCGIWLITCILTWTIINNRLLYR